MNQRDFVLESNGRDCRHGHLARKCELCEMESTLAAREAEIVKLKECVEHYANAALDRLHEIERLKAELSENEGVIRVWRRRTEEAEALVEKRERQLVWALRACGDDEALKFYGLDILAMSDDDAGLLAAIDEATQEKPDRR